MRPNRTKEKRLNTISVIRVAPIRITGSGIFLTGGLLERRSLYCRADGIFALLIAFLGSSRFTFGLL
ncbi:MAG: hypothetical protein V2A78_01630 [bacterium]